MKSTTSYIPNSCKRYFLVFATTVLVLLTSCAVKGSIKSIAGIPVGTEQRIPQNNQSISSNTTDQCVGTEIAETLTNRSVSWQANDLPEILLTIAFLFLLGSRPVTGECIHPRYKGSGRIRGSIPIFLEYQKLIIHYTC